jgi:hypothetical protein
MASPHHVQIDPNLSNGPAMFAEQHEPFAYNQNFSGDQDAVFNPAWSAVDPSLAQGGQYADAAFGQNWNHARSQSSTPSQGGLYNYHPQYLNTTTPFQNSQFTSHGQNFNTLVASTGTYIQPQRPASVGQSLPPYTPSTAATSTVSPAALQSASSTTSKLSNRAAATSLRPATLAPSSQPMVTLSTPDIAPITRLEPPKGAQVGKFLVIDFDELSSATRSRKLHNFLNIGDVPQDLPITKST